jgi:hypothetical protein
MSEEKIVQGIMKFTDSLKSKRSTFDTTYQDITELVMLNGGDFNVDYTAGTRRDRRVFDSTAIQAVRQLASILNTGLTDPTKRFFSYKSNIEEINENRDFKIWLDSVHKKIFREFTKSTSGFSQQNGEFYLNLVSYGTPTMWVINEPGQGITFNTRPAPEIYVSANNKGIIDTTARFFKFTARQAAQEWPEDVLGQNIKEALAADPSKEFCFRQLVEPIKDYERSNGKPDFHLRDKNWISTTICVEDENILATTGFHENPYISTRMETIPGNDYGYNPTWNALSDIEMLQVQSEVTIKADQKQVDPPTLLPDDGVLGSLQTFPGGTIIGGIEDGVHQIAPMPFNISLSSGLEMMEQRRKAVRAAYFLDQFSTESVQPKTATEINDIRETRFRLLGPQVKRIEDGYLTPLVDRVFGILKRNGEIPKLPESLLAILPEGTKDVDLELEFISPLSFTQRSTQLLAVNRFFANSGGLLEFDPGAIQELDIRGLIREGAELSGIDIKYIRPKEEVAAEQQAQAQEQQQQEQMAQIQSGAETVATLQKAGIPVVPEE